MLRDPTTPPLYDAPAEPTTEEPLKDEPPADDALVELAEPEVPPSPWAEPGTKELEYVGPCVYMLYWIVLFAAFWFGSARFDVDGDGDFDEYDVRKFLEDKSILRRNFKADKGQKPAYLCAVDGNARRRKEHNMAIVAGDPSSPQGSMRGTPSSARASPAASGAGDAAGLDIARGYIEADVEGQDEETYVKEKLLSGQSKPLYIILVCLVPLFLFVLAALAVGVDDEDADLATDLFGLDTAFNKETFGELTDDEKVDVERNGYEGVTDLRASRGKCIDVRWQVWRWWTYQFTHVGWPHLLVNILLNIIFGIPLEGVHGTRRMVLMYNIGVLGGACANFVFDAHATVVGMSGGCYTLMGMHVADLIMNWNQKRYRKACVILLATAITADLLVAHAAYDDESDSTSYATHAGGAISGLLIGIIIGKNYEIRQWEKVLVAVCTLLLPILLGCTVLWYFTHDPPRNIYERDSWCWQRAVWNYNYFGDRWQCVRCGSKACAELWTAQQWLRPLTARTCDDPVYPAADGSL
mmetsp:Transcript_56060/g.126094  ORF Transcript_56060/g.126094 Transcript_56060/m.126094 type:complete len:525 (-) Transcript_56060:73-1647(-)